MALKDKGSQGLFRVLQLISVYVERAIIGILPLGLTFLELFVAYNEAAMLASLMPLNQSAFTEFFVLTLVGCAAGIMFPYQISYAVQATRFIKQVNQQGNGLQSAKELVDNLKFARSRFIFGAILALAVSAAIHITSLWFLYAAVNDEETMKLVVASMQSKSGLVAIIEDHTSIGNPYFVLGVGISIAAFVLDLMLGSLTSASLTVSDYYPQLDTATDIDEFFGDYDKVKNSLKNKANSGKKDDKKEEKKEENKDNKESRKETMDTNKGEIPQPDVLKITDPTKFLGEIFANKGFTATAISAAVTNMSHNEFQSKYAAKLAQHYKAVREALSKHIADKTEETKKQYEVAKDKAFKFLEDMGVNEVRSSDKNTRRGSDNKKFD